GGRADADDGVPAVRRSPFPPPPGRRGRLGTANQAGVPARRADPSQGNLCRRRRLPARLPARLPDAGPPPVTGREPAAVRLQAPLAEALLRGLAAARARGQTDPGAPSARERHPTGGRAELCGRAAAGEVG